MFLLVGLLGWFSHRAMFKLTCSGVVQLDRDYAAVSWLIDDLMKLVVHLLQDPDQALVDVEDIGDSSAKDFYNAMRVMFVHRKEDRERVDKAFSAISKRLEEAGEEKVKPIEFLVPVYVGGWYVACNRGEGARARDRDRTVEAYKVVAALFDKSDSGRGPQQVGKTLPSFYTRAGEERWLRWSTRRVALWYVQVRHIH